MNFYSGYRVHNYHFAAYGAMYLGQYAPAIAAADELIDTMPEEVLRTPSPPMADFFESYVSIRQHVLVRSANGARSSRRICQPTATSTATPWR